MKSNIMKRPGLILLVVLGMLALFSLLAITYVLFSGHSRSASVALARSEIRGNTNCKPLFEEAIKQLTRGTSSTDSALFGHDLLSDLYGANESELEPLVSIRDFRILPFGGVAPMTYTTSNDTQRPMILGGHVDDSGTYRLGHFLRIPLNPGPYPPSGVSLPDQHDALTGRVVTFPFGEGPLSGQSFRVVRYIGRMPPSSTAEDFAQSFSITIDLVEADLNETFSQVDAVTNRNVTKSVGDWALEKPPVVNNLWTEGAYLCYKNVDNNPNTRYLGEGYRLFFNATPLNTHGPGVFNDGASQIHPLTTDPGDPLFGTAINEMAVGLQTRYQDLNMNLVGDADEPYDAPDYNNFFLAHRFSGATSSADIIPSFHRAALINYIVNWKPLAQYTEAEFVGTLKRIQLVAGRPLSLDVRLPNLPAIQTHPNFTGGNPGTVNSNPSLNLIVPAPWATNWPTAGVTTFQQWLNFLTAGPWDVDNDSDGITDSVWTDIGLPLQTSADGKLLKALVAYYVDDLDSRLDVNATGSVPQANLAGTLYGRPTTSFGTTPPVAFSKGFNHYFPQGMGYGSADTSFRHLFQKPNLSWQGLSGSDTRELAYREVMYSRYRRNPTATTEVDPGGTGDDPLSFLNMRERRTIFRHGALPGLPVAIHGRTSYGLDRLGNPLFWNVDAFTDEGTNDPYESRLVTSAHQDSPFSLAEWERIYRVGDSDRSALPVRLQERFGETESSLASSSLRHEIAPATRHLRVPKLSTRSLAQDVRSPRSFWELVNTIRALKSQTTIGDYNAFAQLFPLEFSRGLPLNLNRPFGNGIDDDNDGEIDEPGEVAGGQLARYFDQFGAVAYANAPESYTPGVSPVSLDPKSPPLAFQGNESRQLYARHLYCLAQLIVPEDYVFPNIDRTYFRELLHTRTVSAPTSAEYRFAVKKLREIRGRVLAQWAVNVVDYRDSDGAMTRFPYDSAPFHSVNETTQVLSDNYDWTPDSSVVWGLEQPELLLTESFATHDTRVRKETASPTPPDRYLQHRTPEGSLFLELYCPRTTEIGTTAAMSLTVPGVPTSLYTNIGGEMVLDVSRLTPDGQYPVWRIYVSGPIDRSYEDPPLPLLQTPNERLLAESHADLDSPTRFDLTYQLPTSNIPNLSLARDPQPANLYQNQRTASGLVFDYAFDRFRTFKNPRDIEPVPPITPIPTIERQALSDPNPATARVILFNANVDRSLTPGVEDPRSQVYFNQGQGANENVRVRGNEYLVVGPREITYFGSRKEASQVPSVPNNAPNNHRIELLPGGSGVEFFNATDPNPLTRANTKTPVAVIVGAELSDGRRPNGTVDNERDWTSPINDLTYKPFVGINVSEPTPNHQYYRRPTFQLNSDDTEDDAMTGASGFGNPDYINEFDDAYHDYVGGTPAPATAPGPEDDGIVGPLRRWNFDTDNAADLLPNANVVRPGTYVDWSTAYLQRLADPNRPWDATFNPYITVDWIPIDLTVFNGEDDREDFDFDTSPPTGGEFRFATRQKVGQTMDATTLEFKTSAVKKGETFLSALSSEPPQEDRPNQNDTPTFLGIQIPVDDGGATRRPANADGQNSFATLGFLNSHFVFAAEFPPTAPVLPPVFAGAPGDPLKSNPSWHPDSLFWANREFVNSMEIAYVPLSSPGQLMQEFSGTVDAIDAYGPAFSELENALPRDPRMPTAPVTTPITTAEVADADWPPGPEWPPGALRPSIETRVNNKNVEDKDVYYPYSHLLNFFQEVPELPTPSPVFAGLQRYNQRHPKNTSLALLIDLTETPSPWIDATKVENPIHFRFEDPALGSADLRPLIASNNAIFGPLRAPYNAISNFVEPGRVNLNTVSEENVFQGLWSNTLEPSDVDFPPYESVSTPFGGPEDIDHNSNGVNDQGGRARLASAAASWNLFVNSRRGFDPVTSPGYYAPPVTRPMSRHFPTEFAGVFKPSIEAGMVPVTRNPIPAPSSTSNPAEIMQMNLHRLASRGPLEMHARQNPLNVTLMRAQAVAPAQPYEAGIYRFGNQPLATTALTTARPVLAETQRNAFTDLYPMTRLGNLTTDRSNVFAVYVTVGFFEYDPSTDSLGIEYGVDQGKAERCKAFYVIDRSKPVGFRVGQDHNVEKTILIRRYLNN